MELQTFAYCVKTGLGFKIETMRFSKKESIRAYMDLVYSSKTDLCWRNLTPGDQKCVKVEIKVLTKVDKFILRQKQ